MDQGVFVSRNEAETTTLGELLDRYLIEYTADKKGAVSEACRIRKLLRHPLAKRFVESIRGEIVGLRWQHVNIKRRTAFLPDTKNDESRIVPLSGVAIDVLKSLPRSINGEVFPGVTTMAVKQAFTRARHRAKMDDFHFHDLRHEATTRLFERGLNIIEVSSITGHKDLQMLRRYTHLRAEDLAKKLL